MARTVMLVFCCSALWIQLTSSQCIGAVPAPVAPVNEWGCGRTAPLAGISASSGPGLVVSSASPVAPVGVSVVSENAMEGAVAVGGALPYLGAVALEAALPTVGAGGVAYECGDGAVAITAEDIGAVGFAGVAGPLGYVPGITGPIASGLAGSIAPGLAGPIAPGLAGPIGLAPGCGVGAIL